VKQSISVMLIGFSAGMEVNLMTNDDDVFCIPSGAYWAPYLSGARGLILSALGRLRQLRAIDSRPNAI